MSREHIRKIIDQPTIHLTGHDYTPPPTRDPLVRALRHGRPQGTITLEQQAAGTAMIPEIIGRVRSREGLLFASRFLGAAAFNSSWYMQGREAPVMRRVARLPKLADDEIDWRQTPEGLLASVSENASQIAANAGIVAIEHTHRTPNHRRLSKTGRGLADLSLGLASLQVVEGVSSMSAAEAQLQAWEASQEMVALSRTLGGEIGTNPSVAALADTDSDFSVYWRRNAPDDAYQALVETAKSLATQ